MILTKKWGILIKKESKSLDFTGLEIPRDYNIHKEGLIMANQTELLNVSDEMKLDKDRQNLCEELSAGELCSSSLDTTEELYSSSVPDTC